MTKTPVDETTEDTANDTTEETTMPAEDTKPTAAPANGSTNVVFVGSLAWATTDESLRKHFEDAGLQIGEDEMVKNDMTGREFSRRAVTVARYPDTKRSRGYGFVTLATPEEAQKAVDNLNGSELDGREIRVQLKDMTPREDRPRRTFGGGDRRGGDRRTGGFNRRDNFNRRDDFNSTDSWAS